MSTQLFFSHRIDTLADRLAGEVVRACRECDDPLRPLTVLTPNNSVKRYLQLAIAENVGITANINFPTLQQGLGELFLKDQAGAVQLLGADEFRFLTCSAIMTNIHKQTPLGIALGSLTFLLFDAAGEPNKNFAGRLWEISGQLGHYLTEYELHRQDMVKGWQGQPLELTLKDKAPEVAEMERCQHALYHAIFAPGGYRDQLQATSGIRYLTLPQLASEATWNVSNETLFVFGLSQVSTFHRNLLFSLGNIANLKVFQLNVCSEFWEDVTSTREDRWERLKQTATVQTEEGDEELPWDEHENMLLKWWGKPGRENIRLLSDLETMSAAHLNLETFWLPATDEQAGKTVLHTLQDQILHRTQLTEETVLTQDRSLQIFGAPGVFREVETIYQSILHNLKADPTLKQTEIAVLVPDVGLYKPAIHAVFQRDPRHLGFNLTDTSAADESLYSQALLGIVEIFKGNFSRKQLFELLRNPCFMKGCGIDRRAVNIWVAWCDRLHIYHGFDSKDDGESLRYTWQQGLRRIRLGRLMTGASHGALGEQPDFDGMMPYADLDSGDTRLVETFSATIEGLFRETCDLAEKQSSLAGWYEIITRLSTRFLDIPDDHGEEAAARERLFSQLRSYSLFDPLIGASGIGVDLIKEIILTCIQGIPSRHGSYLSGGVTISAVKANRPVPFKIVYIAGLGEGQFPGRADLSTLDLRAVSRRLGDISRPEEDRFSILETLMGCQDKLYLSYVNRDLQKDQDFYPCSVIVQLINYIEQSIVKESFAIAEMPVDSADERYLAPEDDESPYDLYVNYSTVDRVMCLKTLQALAPDRVPDDDMVRIEQWLKAHAAISMELPLDGGNDTPEKGVELNQRLFEEFLDNPIEASLKHQLKIFQYDVDASDITLIEDEPFFSAKSISRDIIDQTLRRLVGETIESRQPLGSGDLQNAFDIIYDSFYRRSSTPEGVFCAIDKSQLLLSASERLFGRYNRDGLADLLEFLNSKTYLGTLSVGAATEDSTVVLEAPTVQLPNDSIATLSALLPNLWVDHEAGELHQLYLTNDCAEQRDFPLKAKLFRPFLGYLIALSTEVDHPSESLFTDKRFTIHWANFGGIRSITYVITPETAYDYLAGLCHDMVQCPFDMLPYSVLYSLAKKRSELPIPLRPGCCAEAADKARYVRRLEREVMDQIDNPWSDWYSSRLLKLLDYRVPTNAWDLASRRFSLFHGTHS